MDELDDDPGWSAWQDPSAPVGQAVGAPALSAVPSQHGAPAEAIVDTAQATFFDDIPKHPPPLARVPQPQQQRAMRAAPQGYAAHAPRSFGESTEVTPVGPEPEAAPKSNAMLGLALLAVGAGALAGYKLGGGWMGGVAGALLGGAAVNGLRAAKSVTQGTPEADKEAAVAGTYMVLTSAGAAYLLWEASKKKAAVNGSANGSRFGSVTPNPDDAAEDEAGDESDEDDEVDASDDGDADDEDDTSDEDEEES